MSLLAIVLVALSGAAAMVVDLGWLLWQSIETQWSRCGGARRGHL